MKSSSNEVWSLEKEDSRHLFKKAPFVVESWLDFITKSQLNWHALKRGYYIFCSNPIIIHFCRNVMTKVTTLESQRVQDLLYFLTSNKRERERERERKSYILLTIWDACSCMLMELVTQASCRYLICQHLHLLFNTHKPNHFYLGL